MMKLLGLLCIVLSGAGIGIRASAAIKRRVMLCTAVKAFLSELGILMRCSGDTLFVLVSELSERQCCQGLTFLRRASENMSDGMAFPQAWKSALSSDKMLPPELSELLLSLGESLGTSDLDGQLMSLSRAQQELLHIYENALQQYQTKGKLYRCLGILGGMSAALLLC